MTDLYPHLLAEAVAARICHDLAGPAGTVSAAIELAGQDDEALDAATEASTAVNARLRLFRAAWGTAGEPKQRDELARLTADLSPRLRVNLDGLGASAFPAAESRLILCMLLVAQDAMPAGGQVMLSGEAGGPLLLTLSGARAGWPAGFLASLAGERPAPEARTVAVPMLLLAARAAGRRLALIAGADLSAVPALMANSPA